MNIFSAIRHLSKKSPEIEKEYFLSLVLAETFVAGSAWELDDGGKPAVRAGFMERAPTLSWEDRTKLADHIIGKLEYEMGSTNIRKVVFGLESTFIDEGGAIKKEIQPHLKKLSAALSLKPLGFVSLPASISYFLKASEGIPASVILVGVTARAFDVNIFRVGRLAFHSIINRTESPGDDIEKALKAGSDEEVLPSRILLFGSDDLDIEEVKSTLLKYQWTTKSNFMHYPKIETFPISEIAKTVGFSGASELTQTMGESQEEEPRGEAETEVRSEKEMPPSVQEKPEEKEMPSEEKEGPVHMVVVQPETLGFHETHEPGIRAPDTISETQVVKEEKEREEYEEHRIPERPFKAPRFPQFSRFRRIFSAGGVVRRMPKKVLVLLVLPLLAIGILAGIAITVLPRAYITISVLSKTITREETIGIDPQVTTPDILAKVIPAKKIEREVKGEKSIPVTGKKKVGDPAKGTVTVYNKSESQAYTLAKGTVLSTGPISYTIDADVTVASASTNLAQGETTFGKASADLTAVSVGAEGNIAAEKEFSFKEYPATVLIARNEKPFSKGTSRDVTVVSRADYDALQKALTADLVDKAKAELAQSVVGVEKMVEDTIKTAVKEKQFMEEIDQEAKDLHGSLALTVTALTYSEDDVKLLMEGLIKSEIPTGFAINPARTTIDLTGLKIGKNEKMTALARLTCEALPSVDVERLKPMLAGKTIDEVKKLLETVDGVSSAEFQFQYSLFHNRMPKNPAHISLTVSVVP